MEKGTLFDSASSVFTTKTTVTGAFAGTGAGLIASVAQLDLVAQVGLCVAVFSLIFTLISFLTTWRYKYLANQRADEIHQLEKLKLQGEINERK